jgi:Flp pilus assembly protein, ATPase CpaE
MKELIYMIESQPVGSVNKARIVLLSTEADFAQSVRSAFGADVRFEFAVVEDWLRGGRADLAVGGAAIVIIDLNNAGQEELSRLQHLMKLVGLRLPFIAVLQNFDELLARKLVQMRIADLLVKPVTPSDLVRGCIRIAQSASGNETKESKIYTFLPVAGGVGATTLAIQSAMTLLNSNSRKNLSTCLVDLNFDRGASADYLDIEPHLDLSEIEPNPERLDRQLLEGMISHHSSGLAVIAAANHPAAMHTIDQNVIMSLLNLVSQYFDHVVIDMPRTWHSWTDNVLLGSNKLFLVSDMSVPGVRHAKQLVAAISTRLGQGPHPKVIVNRFERHFFAPGMRRADLMRALGDSFAGTVPYNRRLVSEAIDRGVPLEEVQKSSNIAGATRKLILPRATAKIKSLLPSIARGGFALSWARR